MGMGEVLLIGALIVIVLVVILGFSPDSMSAPGTDQILYEQARPHLENMLRGIGVNDQPLIPRWFVWSFK